MLYMVDFIVICDNFLVIAFSVVAFTMTLVGTEATRRVTMTTTAKALPSPEDIALAQESGRGLSTALLTRLNTQTIDFRDDKGAVWSVTLPTSALRTRRTDVRPLLTAQLPISRALEAFETAADRSRSTKVQLIGD